MSAQPMERVILHCDANSYYASVCCVVYPIYRGLPLAVCGRKEDRHGIVLAATREAKKLGIHVGMTNDEARRLCPHLVIMPPDYPLFIYFSQRLQAIYHEYTPLVEAFGLDECWLDISNPGITLQDGVRLADHLRKRVWEELGITLSVGVSYNKIFAKLGSDYKKPDATTLITRENYRDIVWPLPVSDLLYVGKARAEKLASREAKTIGDLATYPDNALRSMFGITGITLKCFANGEDLSPVVPTDERDAIKSVSNSATLPHDVTNMDSAVSAIYMLSESISSRLRENGLRGRCVSLYVRDTKLNGAGCQHTISHSTALTGDIAKTAITLLQQRYMRMLPLRSMGISCSSLAPDDAPQQIDLFGDTHRRDKEYDLARSIDDIRRRWGNQIIQRGVVMADKAFAAVNPKEEHLIHPVSYYFGPK